MARDFGGEAHAPTSADLVRAPLTQADDYTATPAAVPAEMWNFEEQTDLTDVRWTAIAGRRQGGVQ